MSQNDFLPFCPTSTGTNLLSEADYLAATDRTTGNQPGLASSKLNNKALRQATYVVSQLAQYVSNFLGEDVLDDNTPAKLLAQFMATMQPIAPNVTRMTSGTGTFNLTYNFFIASGSATTGATYTNNGITYTVAATVASGLIVRMTGNGDPTLGGTLTKASGTGDATLTFYAFRKPISIQVFAMGGGGGGGGSGTATGSAGSSGGDTTFGLHTAHGGPAGTRGGNQQQGGSYVIGTGGVNIASTNGGWSCASGATSTSAGTVGIAGGFGGASFLGGAGGCGGSGSTTGGAGSAAATNSGSGGGGAGTGTVSNVGGAGGAPGGWLNMLIPLPNGSYAWGVGAAGSAEAAGTAGAGGGVGGAGLLTLIENYQ